MAVKWQDVPHAQGGLAWVAGDEFWANPYDIDTERANWHEWREGWLDTYGFYQRVSRMDKGDGHHE